MLRPPSRHDPGRQFLPAGLLLGWLLPALLSGQTPASAPARPNVLLILIDDHAAQLHSAPGGNGRVRTPNLERLAARGTWFTQAYADSPACCPSRTALLTGVHTTRSGVYYNSQAYRRTSTWITQAQTLPATFLRAGYLTAGFGKIGHNKFLEDDVPDYTPGYYRWFDNPEHVRHTEKDLLAFTRPGSVTKMWSSAWTWGILPDDWDRDDPAKFQQDTEQAVRAADLLRQKQDRPFFLACGFWRPHLTWNVPQRYFDLHPLDRIELPEGFTARDLDDVPGAARWLATHRGEHAWITERMLWKRCLQGYYAAISYADDQVGRVLDALEAGPNRDNTIVVFASDNGWHTGEKEHWTKFYLSEQACRVVFSIAVPGGKPGVVATPVGLIDLYPTLLGLCDLPAPATHTLDGIDLSGLIRGTTTGREKPVLSTFGRACHSLRSEQYRYTRYRDGTEELYDHTVDPHEFRNLADEPAHRTALAQMRGFLPRIEAAEVEYASTEEKTNDINRWDDGVFGPERR
jgi:arylsulfatase A-like enzyme